MHLASPVAPELYSASPGAQPSATPVRPIAYTSVVWQMIHIVLCSTKVIVIAKDWSCWLGCLLAVNVPVQAAYITKEIATIFPQQAHWHSRLLEFEVMTDVPDEWQDYAILGLGSHAFLRLIMPKLQCHVDLFIFANGMVFTGRRKYDLYQL